MRQPNSHRRARFSAAFLKRLSSHLVLSTALTLGVAGTYQLAKAATVYWDADGLATNNDTQTGAGLGGVGTWNTATPLWWPGTGATDFAWNNGSLDTALFMGSGAGISLGSDIVANGLVFSGSGYLIGAGVNTLTLDGLAPTILVSTGGTLATVQSSVILNANAVIGGAGNLTLDTGVISGAAQGITKVGDGTLTLGGANTFGGAVALRGGVTSISAANNLGNGTASNTLTLAGGTLRVTNTFNLGATRGPILGMGNGTIEVTGSNNLTVNGALSVAAGLTGGVILTKTGTGTLTLTGTNNTVPIITTIEGGTVSAAGSANLGSARINLNGGTLQITGSTTLTNGISLGVAGGTVGVSSGQTLQISTSPFFGPGSLTKIGPGNLQINAVSMHSGATIISEGTITGGVNSFLPARSALTVATGATLNLATFTSTVSSLSGGGTVTASSTAGVLTLGNQLGSQDSTFSGIFNGSVVISKNGGGTLTLTNSGTAGSSTGAWTLTAGTVKLDYANAGSQIGNILNAGIKPTFGGGTLNVTGRNGASVTQTLSDLTLSAGGSTIRMVPGVGGSTTLTLGTITATAAGGALLVVAPAGTTVKITTTDVTNGTYGGRIVFYDGTNYNWAANGGGASPRTLTAYTSYTSLVATGSSDTVNYLQTGTLTGGITATESVNSLKIATTATGQSLDLNANALTISTGGLLFTGAHDFEILTSGGLGAIKSGTATNDLVVHQFGTGILTISAPIVSSLSTSTLTKAGTGTLILNAANTYLGGTFVGGGTLSVSNVNQLGATATSTITINDKATLKTTADIDLGAHLFTLSGGNATIDVASGTTLNIGGVMTGTGGLTLTGTGTLQINAPSTWTGPTFVGSGATLKGGVLAFINATAGGTLTVATGGLVEMNGFTLNVGAISGSGTITNSGAVQILSLGSTTATTVGNHDSTFSGTLSGAINLAKNGSGVLTLASAATYTGTTNVTNGGIVFGIDNALPTGTLTLGNNGGFVSPFVDLNGFNWTSSTITFYGTSGGTSSQARLILGATSVLTLGGTVSFVNNTTPANSALPAFITGGTIELSAARSFSIADSPNAAVDLTITSSIASTAGAFGITKTGAGTLLLTGVNTYTGGTTINGASGVLALNGSGTLGATNGLLTITNGTLDLNGTSQTVGAFSGAAAGNVRNSAAGTVSVLTVGTDTLSSSQLSYAGTFTDGNGQLALVKSGDGFLTLTGANTYTGGTQIKDGLLLFANTSSKPAAGLIQVSSNATIGLGVGGAGFFGSADVDGLFFNTLPGVSMSAGASVAIDTTAGDFVYATDQSAARALIKLGSNVLTLSGTNSYTGGTTVLGGTLSISSDANLGATSGPLSISASTLRITGTNNPTLHANRALTVSGALTLDVTDSANTFTVGQDLNPTGTFTKIGGGTFAMTGSFTSANNIVISGGTLSSSGTTQTGAGTTAIGNSASTQGALRLLTGATFSTTTIGIGGNATGSGSLIIRGGDLSTTTTGTSSGIVFGNGGYGGIHLTGGSLATNRLETGTSTGVDAVSVLRVDGGTLTTSEYILFRNTHWDFTVTGGQVMHNAASANIALGYQGSATSIGAMTVAGGVVDNSGRNISFGQVGNSSALGTAALNLNAGTLQTNQILTYLNSAGTTIAFINFNGGTLKAAIDTPTFIGTTGSGGTATVTAYVNGTFGSFAGGAVIDSNGFNVTVPINLIAPTGNGVSSISLTSGGSGYTAAPFVEITGGGGGTGATAYAVVDTDPASANFGKVTGIVVTNPGVGYTSAPTVNLLGGGGSGATLGTPTTAANSSGGLTKTGAGTLTLTGVNTFTGATVVNGGVLSIAPGALPNTASLSVGTAGSASFDLYQDGVAAAWNAPTNAGITLGGASTSGALGFQLGTAFDSIILSGTGGLTVNAGGGFINATALGGFGIGSYPIITGAAGITGSGNLQLGMLPSGYTYSLSTTSSTVTLNVLSAVAAGDLYWTGDLNSSWSQAGANTNWSTAANGSVDSGFTPGINNVIYFSATNASASPIATTLDSAVSIQGLKFLNSGTGAVSIAPGVGGTLTIGVDGIEVQTGSPASTTISAPVIIGAAQTWNVADSGSLLTLSGLISGGVANSTQAAPGTSVSLTITGSGAVAIGGGANTFTGDILVDGGTLRISSLTGWGGPTAVSSTSHTITLTNGGTLSVTSGSLNPGTAATTSYNLVQIGSGGGILDIAAGATLQLDDPGQFFGAGNVTKNGVGTLVLRSQTTYSGNIIIAAGTLQMSGTSGGFGVTTGTTTTISSGAALNLNGQANTDVESLTISGTGLASAPTGVITNSNSSSGTFAGPITLAANSTVGAAAAGGITLSGGISGNFVLTIANSGTGGVTLSGASAHTGGIVVKRGTLSAATNAGALGSAGNVITLGDTSGSENATLQFQSTVTFNNTPINVVAGTSGTLTIAGSTTTGGPVVPGAITLNHDLVIAAGATGATTAALTLSGGITGTGNISINYSATALTGAVTISNVVNNLGSITNTSNTTGIITISAAIGSNVTGLTQNSASSILSLTGNNRGFAGNATITNGTLRIGNVAALSAANTVSLAAGGTLNLNAFDITIAGLNGSGTATNTGAAKTLTLGGNGNYGFSGAITGTTPANMALTVALTDSGVQTLSGVSTYTGATTLNRGTLVLDFDNASTPTNLISSASALVLGGGTLRLLGDALTSSQTFASTTLTTGTYSVVSATAGAGGLALDLAALTRNLNTSLNINLVANPTVSLTGVSTTNGVAVGSNGAAFLTLNTTDWGTIVGSNPVVATYQNNDFSAPTNNVNVSASGPWSSTTVNTLRFNTGTLSLTLGGSNILSAGGLLVGSGAGAVTIGGTGTLAGSAAAGTVAAPVPGELGIFQHSASALTVNAPIVNHASGLSYVTATPTGTALNQYGTGTVILGSTRNAYTGGTNIASGVLRLGAAEVIPDGAAQPGAVNIAAPATLDLAGFSETINGLTGTGTVENTSATAATLYIGNGNATSTFSGVLQNTGGAASLALNKIGTGTITLSGTNTYGGATTVSAGGLTLNFAQAGAPITNMISSASALRLGSGILTVTGPTAAIPNISQTFNGTTLIGGGTAAVSGSTSGLTRLILGTIVRDTDARGTLNVTGVNSFLNVSASNSNNSANILGGWATVGGNSWATMSGGNIVALTGEAALPVSGGLSTENYLISTTGTTTTTASQTINAVRFSAAGIISIGTGFNLNVSGGASGASGGILAGITSGTATISGSGTLTAGAGNELDIYVNSGGTLAITSVVSGGDLVKSGAGTLTFANGATNTMTGQIVINGGTLLMDATARYGSTTGFTLNGGTLTWSPTGSSLAKQFTLGAASSTINLSGTITSGQTLGLAGDIGTIGTGARILTLTGGTSDRLWTFSSNLVDGAGGPTNLVLNFGGDNRSLRLSAANTFTGTTTIARGVLDFSATTAIPGGITNAATVGNIIFAATGVNRAILQSSVASPAPLTRTLGYGNGQIHWEGSGGFSNNAIGTTWAVNIGGVGAQLVWGVGGFVPTGSSLMFGATSITNGINNQGAVNFQNGIDLGDQLRIIDAASANDKQGFTPYDVILSGDLVSSLGGGFNKTGAGAMILTGNNSASTTTLVTLSAGALIFEDLNAIPGTGANITLSTATGGNSAIGLIGDTNPIATWTNRITNAGTATSAFALGADSSIDFDFTLYPNMRLAAFAFGLPTKAITYTGKITPANSTYLLGGTPFAGDAINGLSTSLVLANRNALTGGNALNMSYGNVVLLGSNDFTGGTIVDGNAIGESAIGLGSNASLGTGNIALNGTQTKAFGAINGDRILANNINWAGSGTSWVVGGDAASEGLSGTTNGGGITYLGTITISNSASAPTILSRTSHQVILLGNVNNGILTSGLTYNATSAGLISSLATSANGGVAKTYSGTSIINSVTTLVIDSDSSLGASGNISMGGSGSAGNTATLRLQPGSGSVTLAASRSLSFTSDRNFEMRISAGDTMTIAGVVNAQGTNTAARNIIKTDTGTLVFTNKNAYTGAATFSPGLVIRGGTIRLDSSAGTLTAATDRFFPDAVATALPISFSSTTGNFAGGGTLEILQASGNAFDLTQGFGAITFNTGANVIKLTNNSSTRALTLNLGAFTRTNLLGGAVNFVTSSAGGINTIASTATNSNGIIGGYATFNDVDWATVSGGNIIALPSGSYTTNLPGSGSTAAANYIDSQVAVTITVSQSINSLKLKPTASGQTITINTGIALRNTTNVATVSLGLLFDNTNGSSTITSTSSGTGTGQLNTTGSELIVHTYGSGNNATNKLTLNGVLKGAASVISKSGPGTLVLAGVNNYTGALIINAGVVEYANGSATGQNLGSPTAGAGNIILNGGTLRQTATNNLIFGITVNGYAKIDVPIGATLTQTAQGVTGKGGVTGILQKTGAGTLTFSGATDNPSLSLEVTNGVVNLSKTSSASVHSVGVAAGSAAATTYGAALLIGAGGTVYITSADAGNDQIHDQSSVVIRSGGSLYLGGGSATAESFDSLSGTGLISNVNLTGTFTLTLGAGNNVNVSAYSVAAADAGVAAAGLNNFSGTILEIEAGKMIALTKTGSGIQILSGQNRYSGATTIAAGTLQLGITGALPTGVGRESIYIVGNGYGAGTINGGTSIGTADKIAAPGTLDMGGFNQTINGLNSTTGGYVLNNPTLSWNGGAWVAAASSNILTLGNADANGSFNGTLSDGYTVGPGASTAVGYVGTLGLTKMGSGTQVLSGANTYLGVTTINGGTLQFGRSVSLYNAVTSNWTATNLVVNSGTIAAFNVGGAGEFNSSQIDIVAALGTGSGGFLSGSRIAFDTTNASGAFVYNTAIANTNGGANTIGLIKTGTGTLQLGGSSSYSGGTFITAGTLRAMSNSALGATNGSVTISNNATLQAGASFDTGAGRAVAVGAGGARIDTNGNNVVVGGAISGSASLQKDGAGKLDFNGAGANSFSGGVTVNAGTLAVNTNLSSASMTVQSGAILSGGGSVGAVTVQSGGTVAPGNSPGILTTADFDLKSGAHLSLEIGLPVAGDATGYDQVHATPVTTGVSLAGDVKITLFHPYTDTAGAIGTVYTVILNSSALPTIGTFSNTLSPEGWIASEDGLHFFSVNYAANVDGGNNDVTLTLQAVPEPNAVAMLAGSLGLALGLQRFRRRR